MSRIYDPDRDMKANLLEGKARDVCLLLAVTAWVKPNGTLQRKDIYRRDRRLNEALDKNPPRAAPVGQKTAHT